MSLQYKIFYVSYDETNDGNQTKMINQMNELITTKLNEGWKLVGSVSFIAESDSIIRICQAMTMQTVNQNLLE